MRLYPAFGLLFLCIIAVPLIPRADLVETTDSKRDFFALAKGRLIVKYEDTVQDCVHCLLKNRSRFNSSVAGGSNSLDELHSKFEVRKATPLFRTEREESEIAAASGFSVAGLKQYHRQRLERVRNKFTARSRRIPVDASLPDLHHIYVLEFPSEFDVRAAASEFRNNPHVEYAHPDYIQRIDAAPNDPYYRSSGSWGQRYDDLWGLKKSRMNLEPAWEITKGKGIVVAVVDTGIDYTHSDIDKNVWKNPDEVADNGKDDDRNGFVDDKLGWNFVECKHWLDDCGLFYESEKDPMDDQFHGTHVAGTIAAIGNNRTGIIGVAPEAQVMAVKAFGRQGFGFTSDTSAALMYAMENGADVINNSWACGFCPDAEVYKDAVRAAEALGVVVVFGAGNSAVDVRIRSPHNMHDPKPIVVAATNAEDRPTFFTDFGATVDIGAPGGGKRPGDNNILSLRAKECFGCRPQLLLGDHYLLLQGTSMATPHAAGLAALILSARPNLTTKEVRSIMKASADDIHKPGLDAKSGAGRLNAAEALPLTSAPNVKIESPKHLLVTNSSGISIRGSVTGPGVTRHQLSYSVDGGETWKSMQQPVSGTAQNALMGQLNLAALPLGWKSIKLEAVSTNGKKFYDVIEVGNQLKSTLLKGERKYGSKDPYLSENLIVWAGDTTDEGSYIYVHDLRTKRTRKVSDGRYVYPYPRASDDVIAWQDEGDRVVRGCVYDVRTSACHPFEVGVSYGYMVSGTKIVYESGSSVSVYNALTGEKSKLETPPSAIEDISGDLVLLRRRILEEEQSDLFVYNLKTNTEKRITNTPQNEWVPAKIVGNRILFIRTYDRQRSSLYSLFLYDLATNSERLLFRDFRKGHRSTQFFSGDYIVWSNVSSIEVYDIRDKTVQTVIISPLVPRISPSIVGRRLVWINVNDFVAATGALYTATLPNP